MLKYESFVELVNELGFMSMNDVVAGFPKIGDYIVEGQYWSDNPELDPWIWKDRVAAEKKLLYGSYFNSKKGVISPRFYSIFYCAFHPNITVEERYKAGKLNKQEWDVWNLLNKEGRALGTHEIRKLLGVTPKSGASSVDTAMLDKENKPYNKSVQYDLVERWVPDDWYQPNLIMSQQEALEKIYERAFQISNSLDLDKVKKIFNKQIKLLKRFSID